MAKGNICSCMRNITSFLVRSQDHIHGKCFYVHSLPQESIRLNFVFLNFVCLNSVWLNFVCLNFVCLNSVCLNFGGLGAHTVLGGPRELPVKTLALLHHMHRAQLPRMSSVRSNLTLFIASWYAGRYGCSLGKLNRLFTLGGQLNDLLMPASRHRKLPRPLQFEAQSTVATYFTGAVSSDVVHLIVLCWALVFRSFRDWSH